MALVSGGEPDTGAWDNSAVPTSSLNGGFRPKPAIGWSENQRFSDCDDSPCM